MSDNEGGTTSSDQERPPVDIKPDPNLLSTDERGAKPGETKDQNSVRSTE